MLFKVAGSTSGRGNFPVSSAPSTIFPLADLLTSAVIPGDLRDKLTALITQLPQPGFRDLTLHPIPGGLELHTILVAPL
jgi:hypothetical protein